MPIPFRHAIAILLSVAGITAAQDERPPITFPFRTISQFSLPDREVTGFQKAIFSDPVLDERRVYFAGTNGVLYARYKDSFASAWTFSVDNPIQLALCLAPGDRIVLAAGSSVYCLRRLDGLVLWIADVQNPVTAGVLSDGERIVVADSSGGVLCLNAADGATVWRQPGVGEATSAIRSPLLSNEGTVFAGSDGGIVIALSMRDGRIIWTARAAGPVRSGFAVADGTLYFGSDDNYVYALNAATGSLAWRQRTPGDVSGRPVVRDDVLHISARDRTIRLFNAGNGHPLDQSPITLVENFDAAPLVSNDLLIYPQRNTIVARALLQNYITRGAFLAPAEISTAIVRDEATPGLFYCGTRTGEFLAIGSVEWQIGPQPIVDTAAVAPPPVVTEVTETAAQPEERPRRDRTRRPDEKQDPQPARSDTQPETPKTEPADAKPATPEQAQPLPVEAEKTEPEKTPEPITEAEPEKKNDELTIGDAAPATVEPPAPAPYDLALAAAVGMEPAAALAAAQEFLSAGDIPAAAAHFLRGYSPERETKYTVSLGLYCLDGSVAALVDRYKDEDVVLFARKRGEQVCYFVCLGIFDDKPAAQAWIDGAGELLDKSTTPRAFRLDSFIPVP